MDVRFELKMIRIKLKFSIHTQPNCSFNFQGAERKTRDEERRAAKRKMTATGRKKLDELYHPVVERSEFYSMSDLGKPPVLFSPAEDLDKIAGMELQGFYGHDDGSLQGDGHIKGASPFLLHAAKPATPTLKFHNHFPPDTPRYMFVVKPFYDLIWNKNTLQNFLTSNFPLNLINLELYSYHSRWNVSLVIWVWHLLF